MINQRKRFGWWLLCIWIIGLLFNPVIFAANLQYSETKTEAFIKAASQSTQHSFAIPSGVTISGALCDSMNETLTP